MLESNNTQYLENIWCQPVQCLVHHTIPMTSVLSSHGIADFM